MNHASSLHSETKNRVKSDLMKEIGVDMDEIQRRMDFIGFTKHDIKLLSQMEGFAKAYADEAIAAFYQHLLSFRETRILLRNQDAIDRLISSQKNYILEIFKGQFDKAYFERRLRTGAVHHRIGLKPKWYMEIYAFYENSFSSRIAKAYQHEPDRGLARDQALRKIFRIDMALSLEYYFHSSSLEMTKKLENNVQGMDEFTRMLAHDLKEPLRGIEAFSSFLLEDYTRLLDNQGKRYLNYLKESATRMKELIQDLMTLVSISPNGQNLDRIDLNVILEQVKQDLGFAIQQKDVIFSIPSSLPVLRCDPIQITEVYKNLISNAIKFNKSTPPRVEITAKEDADCFVLSVADNGIGIEPEYQDQVLLPFERLHHRGEYEGTGIGLAICKKAVETSGGKMWLTSTPGSGTIFYFTLPKDRKF